MKHTVWLTLLLSSISACLDINQLPDSIRTLYVRHLEDELAPDRRLALGNALLNEGNNYFSQNNLEQALSVFEYLTQLFSQSAAINHNMAYTLAELNRPHDAIPYYHKALALDPENNNTHICLATALLASGAIMEGFTEYEWRWREPHNTLNNLALPIWQQENLTNKKILVRSEGSFGDIIQFIRYAELLKKLGATVIVQTLSPLQQLLQECPYIDHIITPHESCPEADYQIALMSLAHRFYGNIPTNIPYMFAKKELITLWEPHFDKKKFNIGICWQADPTNDANRPRIAQRSIPLSILAHISPQEETAIYSLQAIDGTDQINACNIHTFGANFDTTHGRFMDTTAIMHHLDLVITVDTSIAHLAGALGIPTITILPFKADWRWMTERTDTPWYPTMKLIRKPYEQNWTCVANDIKKEIELHINQKKETSCRYYS